MKKWGAMLVALAGVVWFAGIACAGEVRAAVAANFTTAARQIGAAFTADTGHTVVFSFGSTGQLFTQIIQGAPFEVFLAADQARPARAVSQGYAVPGSRFTYAAGAIVLYSSDPGRVTGERTLRDGAFERLAIANPATAPYGQAAVEALRSLGVYDGLAERIVRGNNIAQTYQFVETGNAELGFVALSQVAGNDRGSRWIVPVDLYPVIAQDAVLLNAGEANEAARTFLAFLRGDSARAIKSRYGYGAGD